MTIKEYKYNYVLFVEFLPVYKSFKASCAGMDNVLVLHSGLIRGGRTARFLHKIHWSAKINRRIKLPLKKIWYRRMTDAKFRNPLPVCYIFFGGQYCIQDIGLCNYIKKQNPNNRIVAYMADVHTKEHFNKLKINCDMVCTYDKTQAEQNQVAYYDKYASRNAPTAVNKGADFQRTNQFKHDLYFIGYAKDRLEKILNIYSHLTNHGVRCLIQLAGVPKAQRVEGEGIEYLEKDIPYDEVLSHARESRCLLEVLQGSASGKSLRMQEAINLRRKLLTNRAETKNENLFSDAQLSVFETLNDIDIDFLKADIDYDKCVDPDAFSPTPFLDFIEDKLLQN